MAIDAKTQVWDGIFSSFNEAGAESAVFEDDIWLGKVIVRARDAIVCAQSDKAIADVATSTEYALSVVASLVARPERALSILDFGGGRATSFLPLIKILPDGTNLNFVTVENEAVCKVGLALFTSDARVSFRSDVPKDAERFDIVLCGNSLHYVDDWKAMLAQFAALYPSYMIFADLPAADNKTFVTTQLFHGRRIPVRFWNLAEFVGQVGSLGYKLIYKARYRGYYLDPNAELPTGNFDEAHRLTYTSQLIFRGPQHPEQESN